MKLDKNIDSELRKLFGFNKSTNISAEDMKRVDVLSLENRSIKSINDLVNMKRLKALNISGTAVGDISVLSNCLELEKLAFYETNIKDISVISNLVKLRELYFDLEVTEDNYYSIGGLNNLELLDIKTNMSDLSFLSELKSLKYLHINVKHLNLRGVEFLENLEYIEIDAKDVENWTSLKNLMNLKEVVYLNLSSKDKEILEKMSFEVNQVAETSPFDPVFISELSTFKLDSKLKEDAKSIVIAMAVLTLIVLMIGYGVLIFNENSTMTFFETTAMFSITFWIGLILGFWLYFMHFELEFKKEHLYVKTMLRKYLVPYEEIKSVRRKHLYMRQPKIRIKTDKLIIRLTCSIMVSNKSLVMLMNEFKKKGIDTETNVK